MINNKQKVTLEQTIEYHGKTLQQIVAMEELAELQQAISKNIRNHSVITENNLAEEMADVYIMLKQLEIIHNNYKEVRKQINYKILRLENMMLIEQFSKGEQQ